MLRYTNSDKCIECHKERNDRRKRGKEHNSTRRLQAQIAALKESERTKTGEVLPPEPVNKDWRSYATRIAAAWRKTTESIIETGKLLIEAKANLDHGDWLKITGTLLPFSEDTAQRLMAIARHPVISNTEHVRYLPPSWGTLYQLTKVSDKALIAGIEDHSIHPDMERKEVALLLGPGRQTKRNNKPTPADTFKGMAEEIEGLKSHVAELEAARDTFEPNDKGQFLMEFLEDNPEPELARKIVMVIGKERTQRLIIELSKRLNQLMDEDLGIRSDARPVRE